MSTPLRWLGVFIVTLVVCVTGSMPVFVTGLVVHEAVSYPLTLLVMGLLAALASSWMSNFLSGGPGYSRILLVTVATELLAVLLVPLRGMIVSYLVPRGPGILLLAIGGAVLSLSACLAARRFRAPVRSRRRDMAMSLILLALAPVVVVVAIAIASRFGLTGA